MDDIKDSLIKRIPFYRTLGFRLIEIKDGHAHFEMDIREELTQNGMIHGGVLASMIDASCACAAFSSSNFEGFVTTIDLQVSYLKPISKGKLTALAECLRAGKKVLFCESKIRNEEGELICVGTSQLLRI